MIKSYFSLTPLTLSLLGIVLSPISQAADNFPVNTKEQADRVQQNQFLLDRQRDNYQQQQWQPNPDVRLDDPAKKADTFESMPSETPCFPIQKISLAGEQASRFRFALDKALGAVLDN